MALCVLATPVSAQMGHQLGGDQKPDRRNHVLSYAWMMNAEGFTFCLDGRGYSFARIGQTEIERLDTEAHELKHQEQYTRFPSCESFDLYYTTLRGRVESETEAFAAGLCVAVGRGMNREFLERNFAERISFWYTGGQVSPLTLVALLRKYEKC